ncbi:MAG: alcohol dehydrogenase catalytic domain-containing protein, partial [Limibacillus sp.]
MRTNAVVIEAPKRLSLSTVELTGAEETDILVDVAWSGISGGTERLLWSGTMPAFPGMGYPLIPGYEAVGEVLQAGEKSGLEPGDKVFVPGARCFTDARSLFGGQAKRLVTHGARALKLQADAGSEAVLMALAATARHALRDPQTSDGPVLPDLIVGHGVLGRLLARLTIAAGAPAPVVWETNPEFNRQPLSAPTCLDWRDLARWNSISAPYTIYPDQELRVSPPSRPKVTTAPAKTPAPVKDRPAATSSSRSSDSVKTTASTEPPKPAATQQRHPRPPRSLGADLPGVRGRGVAPVGEVLHRAPDRQVIGQPEPPDD